ncbi:restriction endonuclease subunit S [Zobellella taiwanensis]
MNFEYSEKVYLSDIVLSINTGLDAIRRAPIVEHITDIRCLRIQDISQQKPLDNWGYTEVKDTDFAKYQLVPGDIIMARTCSTGINYLVKEKLPAVFNNGLARIRVNLSRVSPEFLYYVFQSKSFTDYIYGISAGTSVQLNMKVGDLAKYRFELPELAIQKSIASTLGKIDDKIQLNNQINQTLEQMAQAIFKSWFVDFEPVRAKVAALEAGGSEQDALLAAMQAISGKDEATLARFETEQPEQYAELQATAELFPSAMQDSELGEIPDGWEVTSLGSLTTAVTKGTTPRKPEVAAAEDSATIPFIKVKDISDSGEILREGLEFIPRSIHIGSLKRSILEADDVLFSIAGTIGRLAIVDAELDNSNTNQAVGIIRLKNKALYLPFIWQVLKSQRVQNDIASKVVQGVQANASLANLKDIQVIFPTAKLLERTTGPLAMALQKITTNQKTNRLLGQVRDTLLPKLLSGELSLDDVEANEVATA